MRVDRSTWILMVMVLCSALLHADSTETKERTTSKLADGVYEIRHPDAPDTFPQSNTTVIIGDKAVLVVDSCLLPSAAKQDIEQIRQWTNKPVTYLVNTHWHFDHTMGNATYAAAFPMIQIIAQTATQKTIADFNQGAANRYPSREARFRKILDTGKKADGTTLTDDERKDYEKALAGLAPVVAEFKSTTQLVPNVSFDRELNIDLGNRPVQIRFLGRGNTAGDTIVYLPKDKILMTGDLLDHPSPYMFGGFPVDFVTTLHRLAEFDVQTVVPGHGDVLHDNKYILLSADLMQAVNDEVMREINQGKTEDEIMQAVPKAVDQAAWRPKFVGTDQRDVSFFDQSFAGLVKASYRQLAAR
jgi:cyclase